MTIHHSPPRTSRSLPLGIVPVGWPVRLTTAIAGVTLFTVGMVVRLASRTYSLDTELFSWACILLSAPLFLYTMGARDCANVWAQAKPYGRVLDDKGRALFRQRAYAVALYLILTTAGYAVPNTRSALLVISLTLVVTSIFGYARSGRNLAYHPAACYIVRLALMAGYPAALALTFLDLIGWIIATVVAALAVIILRNRTSKKHG